MIPALVFFCPSPLCDMPGNYRLWAVQAVPFGRMTDSLSSPQVIETVCPPLYCPHIWVAATSYRGSHAIEAFAASLSLVSRLCLSSKGPSISSLVGSDV